MFVERRWIIKFAYIDKDFNKKESTNYSYTQ